ncbi:MAG: glycosyltransferase family 39 protein [Nitrospirae bacterium]|nr:glycosyltransferase family 39 protein [Nitrospirota bacterium]
MLKDTTVTVIVPMSDKSNKIQFKKIFMRRDAALYGLYLVVSLIGLLFFVPHNDEIIYAQHAHLIHSDWKTYKYVSMDGSFGGDYKEPLQYWITSLTVDTWDSPIWGVRLWSLITGFCGFFFAKKLIAEIWNEKASMFFVLLMFFSSYFLYFNVIALYEVYIYGFGITFLYFLYRYIENGRFYWAILSLLFLVLLMLCKESAKLWLVYTFFIPLFIRGGSSESFRKTLADFKRRLLISYGKIILIFLCSYPLIHMLLPSEFDAVHKACINETFHRTISEMLDFPFSDWFANTKFYLSDVLFMDYSYPVFVFFLLLVCGICFSGKRHVTFILLIFLWLCSFMIQVVFMKLTLVRHFGMGLYFWYFPVAVSMALVYEKIKSIKKYVIVFWTILVSIGLWQAGNNYYNLLKYGQIDIAMAETKAQWANGLGVYEMLDKLKGLDSGVLIYEPQWGYPGTTIEVFSKTLPKLTITPLTNEILPHLHEFKDKTNNDKKNMYILVDRRSGTNPMINSIINDPDLCAKNEIIPKIYKNEILTRSCYVICKNEYLK